jgi:hypothetical protein
MKSLIFLLLSAVLFLTLPSCKNSHDNFVQKSNVTDSDGWNVATQSDTLQSQILEAQNFVADTSFVSPQSVKISEQELAIKADDELYELSLIRDRIRNKTKKYLKAEKELDSANRQISMITSHTNYLLSRLKSKKNENETVLAKSAPNLE